MATYNQAGSIQAVLAEIEESAAILRRAGIELSVLVVDDASPDGTATIATSTAAGLGLALEVIGAPGGGPPAALGAAFRRLLDGDPPDLIVTLDPDGCHDARQITDLVRMFLARRSGLTIGSRWARGGSSPGTGAARAVASRTASALVRRATGLRRVRDATTSFWVVHPDVVRTVLADGLSIDGYGFYAAFVALAQAYGFSVDEVPIVFRPRYSDVATLSVRDIADFAQRMPEVRARAHEVRAKMRADQSTWAARSGRLRGQDAAAGSSFGADVELERLATAERFFGWIADEIAPHLGRSVLEVGAGIGTVSTALLARRPDCDVTALEPATGLFEDLVARTAGEPRLTPRQQTTADLLAGDAPPRFDSVVYVNVLEHILDDAGELATARELLAPGGSLAVFVPALPRLYGSLDYKSGHHRRYRRDDLAALITGTGFELVDIRYLDLLGVAPYYAMYRVLDVRSLGPVSSTGYDRIVVPLSRTVQRLVPHPPAGKNLLAIARRR
jgi:SAM-dependent methyltransferase